jgi:hypothetical protein
MNGIHLFMNTYRLSMLEKNANMASPERWVRGMPLSPHGLGSIWKPQVAFP